MEKKSDLWEEFEALRIEFDRFRRRMEDILYNLEEENMPTVEERIKLLEKSLDALRAANAAWKEAPRLPILLEQIREDGSGLFPLCIDADGNICAYIP